MRFTNILLFCVLCFYEAKSSTEESFEVSSESIEDISNESGSSITFEEESEDVGEVLLPSSMEALKARVEQNLEILGKTPDPEESPLKLSILRKNFPQVVFSFNFFSHLRWCRGVH